MFNKINYANNSSLHIISVAAIFFPIKYLLWAVKSHGCNSFKEDCEYRQFYPIAGTP